MCAYCQGGDRMTVSYHDDVAHCFRCHWSSSRYKLAKELGIIDTKLTPAQRDTVERDRKEQNRKLAERNDFLRWQRQILDRILWRLTALNVKAKFAREILTAFPEESLAWDALKNLYDTEAHLFSSFDYFAHTKISRWLDSDSTLPQIIELWKHEQRRHN